MTANNVYQEYLKKIRENLTRYYAKELGLPHLEQRIEQRIQRERGKYHIARLAKLIGIQNKRLLDVGSGWGEFLVEAHKEMAATYGIEPDEELLEITDLLLRAEDISEKVIVEKGYAEKIPFQDGSFDIVLCCHVLEHVQDVKKSIQEMMRVLKKDGYFYLVCPNYLYPAEAHYKIGWFPLLPKPLAKVYLRLRGRNPHFIDSINYITSWFLFGELKNYEVTIQNLAKEELQGLLPTKPFIKRILLRIMLFFHLYPEIELLIRKID